MLRNEVEALLAIEGLKLKLDRIVWGKRYKYLKNAYSTKASGRYECWVAKIGFITEVEDDRRIAIKTPKDTFFAMVSAEGLTNHQAAILAYKKHLMYSANYANY